jgi:hypothetical protein
VNAKAETLLIKVKSHRGCPLNEEADIRAEMGRMKEEQEKTWSTPRTQIGMFRPIRMDHTNCLQVAIKTLQFRTSRTIYQWSKVSKTKNGLTTTKQTAWTQVVRNRMRQKAGEIQVFRQDLT